MRNHFVRDLISTAESPAYLGYRGVLSSFDFNYHGLYKIIFSLRRIIFCFAVISFYFDVIREFTLLFFFLNKIHPTLFLLSIYTSAKVKKGEERINRVIQSYNAEGGKRDKGRAKSSEPIFNVGQCST